MRTPHALLTALALIVLAAVAQAAVSKSPYQIIQDTADELLRALDGRRSDMEQHPDRLYALVDDVLRPNFDVKYAGRLIMGRHWGDASAAQREEFVAALYGSVVRRYARGLLSYYEDRVKVIPPRELLSLDDEFITVKTQVFLDDGTMVPVDYRTRWVDEQWKVFDVVVEGRSYVSYYRDTIGRNVDANGLCEVIVQLRGA